MATPKVTFVTIQYDDGGEQRMEFSSVHEPLEQSGTTYTDGETRWSDIGFRAPYALEDAISTAVASLGLWPVGADACTCGHENIDHIRDETGDMALLPCGQCPCGDYQVADLGH